MSLLHARTRVRVLPLQAVAALLNRDNAPEKNAKMTRNVLTAAVGQSLMAVNAVDFLHSQGVYQTDKSYLYR